MDDVEALEVGLPEISTGVFASDLSNPKLLLALADDLAGGDSTDIRLVLSRTGDDLTSLLVSLVALYLARKSNSSISQSVAYLSIFFNWVMHAPQI